MRPWCASAGGVLLLTSLRWEKANLVGWLAIDETLHGLEQAIDQAHAGRVGELGLPDARRAASCLDRSGAISLLDSVRE